MVAVAGLAVVRGAMASEAAAIAWFDGSVDAAFAQAKRDAKPVMLYWGAIWCPPCMELKATVFSQPAFIQKTRLFVPVYLDGDAPHAQRAADGFAVSDYPQLVILAPDRRELLRLSDGLDVSQYTAALDAVLEANECSRLAYNNWIVHDPEGAAARADSLDAARTRCGRSAPSERARLVLAAARLKPTPARVAAVASVLADPAQVRGALELFQSLDREFFDVARQDAAGAARFLGQWTRAMDAVSQDRNVSVTVQLAAIGAKLGATRALSPDRTIAPGVAEVAYQRVTGALARNYTIYERAGVVNSASYVLEKLERNRDAYRMLEGELKGSHTAYYYMAGLGALDEVAGNSARALAWYRRAYESSSGPATRFEWGVLHVEALLRLAPDDETTIVEEGLRVLAELPGPDRNYGRPRMQLERLNQSLTEWNRDGRHAAAIATLRR